ANLDQTVRQLRLKTGELERLNEDLVRATKLKSDFLARMSHELRTPLNSIIGFSGLLLAGDCGPLSDEQRESLEPVLRNGKNLLSLINDILDLSKIEADRLPIKIGPVNFAALVDSAIANLAVRASQKRILLKSDVEPIPTFLSDEVRLLQILNNLLSNAVKFTESGGVILQARMVDAAHLEIAVRDSGIGIDASDLPKLFTEFYQADSSRTGKYEGTGLGLAITKRLVEALGGTIAVESERGLGSAFTVTLAVAATAAEPDIRRGAGEMPLIRPSATSSPVT